MDGRPSFDHIFRLTGFHLGAAALGFLAAALLFAPKPRQSVPMSPRTAQILELRQQARTAAANSAAPALARATELCRALAWPSCDPESVRQMGKLE